MDKSHWPQEWKDQYNSEIRKRKSVKIEREKKDRLLDQVYFPQISEFKIDEENILAMLAYRSSLKSVISRIIQRFISDEHVKDLILSPRYLYYTQKIFPGFYSDRERIVVIMNKFRVSGDINEFISWVQFQTDKSTFHFIHLMIGVIFLDHYLDDPSYKGECLDISIRYLERARFKFYKEESKLTINSLLAFAHYMNQDFDKSASFLRANKNKFEDDFVELIQKVA